MPPRTPRSRLVVIGAVAIACVVVCGAWLLPRLQATRRADALRALYAAHLPAWSIELHNGRSSQRAFEEVMAAVSDVGPRAGALEPHFRGIAGGWPDNARVQEAVDALNDAAEAAGLPYWIDAPVVQGRRLFLACEVLKTSRWSDSGGQEVVVRHVRRIDTTNVVLGFAGHAGGGRPLILIDGIESMIVRQLVSAYGDELQTGERSRRAHYWRPAWRRSLEEAVGPDALAKAAEALKQREEIFEIMIGRLGRGVRLEQPEGFVWPESFFEPLWQATRASGGRKPLLLAKDVRRLEEANARIASDEIRAVLHRLRDLEAAATEAHEVHHVLTPKGAAPAEKVVAVVGADDLRFSGMADLELRAYLGQLHDGAAPACATVAQLAAQTTLSAAYRTPHDFAARVLLAELGADVDGAPPRKLERLCELPEAELRSRAASAWRTIYGDELRPAAPRER